MEVVWRGHEPALLFGASLPYRDLLETARKRWGELVEVDVRAPDALFDDCALREKIAVGTDAGRSVVVLLGGTVQGDVRALVSELVEGQLNVTGGKTRRFGPDVHVLALSPVDSPQEEVASLFALRLPVAQVEAKASAGSTASKREK